MSQHPSEYAIVIERRSKAQIDMQRKRVCCGTSDARYRFGIFSFISVRLSMRSSTLVALMVAIPTRCTSAARADEQMLKCSL